MQVTIEEAYAEACRVIGEQIVTQRMLARAEPTPGIPCPVAGNEWTSETAAHVLSCPACDDTFKGQAKTWIDNHTGKGQ